MRRSRRSASAGGQVLMPATDIGDAGRMAFVADPTGAAVGLWQANQHIGATLVNEPGRTHLERIDHGQAGFGVGVL